MYPFPSFGGFQFKREETAVYGTDTGWNIVPAYSRQRPLGSAADAITTMSIGSADRSFELYLTPERFQILLSLINTKALFTDWNRPVPDSRNAFLAEVTQINTGLYSYKGPNGITRKILARVALVSV